MAQVYLCDACHKKIDEVKDEWVMVETGNDVRAHVQCEWDRKKEQSRRAPARAVAAVLNRLLEDMRRRW